MPRCTCRFDRGFPPVQASPHPIAVSWALLLAAARVSGSVSRVLVALLSQATALLRRGARRAPTGGTNSRATFFPRNWHSHERGGGGSLVAQASSAARPGDGVRTCRGGEEDGGSVLGGGPLLLAGGAKGRDRSKELRAGARSTCARLEAAAARTRLVGVSVAAPLRRARVPERSSDKWLVASKLEEKPSQIDARRLRSRGTYRGRSMQARHAAEPVYRGRTLLQAVNWPSDQHWETGVCSRCSQ
eukprot:scaffold516_cov401-Prasinococcus_capsulatus_cf.AAC.14